AYLRLGDGRRRNALRTADWCLLADQIRRLGTDPAVRAVVVSGTGGCFSAGSDISEWRAADVHAVDRSFAAMEDAISAVESLPVPVVAKLEGVALGAGCQLALACDLRVLERRAVLGMPVTRLGILVTPAFAGRLVRVAGPEVASRLLLTGTLLDSDEARRCGVASEVTASEHLDARVRELVARIVSLPPTAVRAAKQAVRAAAAAIAAPRGAAAPHAVDMTSFVPAVAAFLDAHGLGAGEGSPIVV
ncbi:MAG TPA: enoyl-CoA hydratase/isomerase family protein, partial [Acidimicrobiales bacterium]|nr:enoyl-CoA hydratase/isomerase family protein [Acidimicrobiales bacterium]